MSYYPKSLVRFFPIYVFALAIPVFFLISVLLYEPKGLCELMRAGEGLSMISNVYTFNIIITFTILLAAMSLSRVLLWLLRKALAMDMYKYCIWCMGEIVVCGAFVSLYLVLMARGDGGWFGWLGRSIVSIGSISIFPYLILTLFICAREKATAHDASADARLKFYDNRHQLKFITTAASVTTHLNEKHRAALRAGRLREGASLLYRQPVACQEYTQGRRRAQLCRSGHRR